MKYSPVATLGVLSLLSMNAGATLIGGVEFPDGAISFADEVVSYSPTGSVGSGYDVPTEALGVPDYSGGPGLDYVSLGDSAGGSLVLRFTDNSLTTSGSPSNDLWIFEIGSAIEPVSVDISTDGASWISVGSTTGGTSGVDIDAFGGVVAGTLYSYVRLTEIDGTGQPDSGSPYAGADIDAVGAISSGAAVPDGGTSALMLGLGLLGLAGVKRKLSRA